MKTKAFYTAIGVATAYLVLASLTQGQQPPVDENPVTTGPLDQNEPAIAISPLNNSNLMAGWNDKRSGTQSQPGFCFSTDGGESWGFSGLIWPAEDGFTGGCDPSVAFDRNGYAYYCYVTWVMTVPEIRENLTIYVSRTSDMGGSWDLDTPVSSGPYDDKPYMAVDNTGGSRDGNMYVSWTVAAPITMSNEIRFAYSTNSGVSFTESNSSPLATAEGNSGISLSYGLDEEEPVVDIPFVQGSVPVVAPNGDIYVVWGQYIKHYEPFPEEKEWYEGILKMRKSTNGGITFGEPVTIAEILPEAAFRIHKHGKIRISSIPTIAVDPNDGNNVYIAYTAKDEDDFDIYFVRSTNGGVNWSEPKTITEFTSYKEFMPWLTVDLMGRISLIYYTNRNSVSKVDAYLTWSVDRGENFVESSRRVSTTSSNPNNASFGGDYIGITSEANFVYPIWTDFRYYATDADIFAAIVDYVPLKGDVDANYEINVLDVMLCVNIILGYIDPTPYQFWAADCNSDNEINVLDVICINNLIGGGKSVAWYNSIELAEVWFGQGTEMALAKSRRCVLPIHIKSNVPIAGVQLEIKLGSEAVVPVDLQTTTFTSEMTIRYAIERDRLIFVMYGEHGETFGPGSGSVVEIVFELEESAHMPSDPISEFTFGDMLLANSAAGFIPLKPRHEAEHLSTFPMSYALNYNYPNPFNPETEITFALPEATLVTLTIYNTLGQAVEVLVDSKIQPGYHTVTWNGQNFSSGIYFYRLTADEFSDTKSMVLMK